MSQIRLSLNKCFSRREVSALYDVWLDELLHFEDGLTDFALSLDRDRFNAVPLDAPSELAVGARVTACGEVQRVPVGRCLLGRVVDALGRPLDGGDSIKVEKRHPVESHAPAIIACDAVDQPVATGTAAQSNVEKRTAKFTDRFRRMRQEEITSEIIELARGRSA